MSLAETEKNLDVILEALRHKKPTERALAVSRLNRIDLWVKSNDFNKIASALTVAYEKETNKVGKKRIKKMLNKYTVYLNSTEKQKAEIIAKFKNTIEEKKHRKEMEESARKEAIELKKEQAKRAEEETIFHRNRLIKERMEYEDNLREDKAKNPHLALISDHLWWLALAVKVGFVLFLLQIIFLLMFLG